MLRQDRNLWHHQGIGGALPDEGQWSPAVRGKLAHALRESWRCCRFHEFLASGHHTAAGMQNAQYDPARMTQVSKSFYGSAGAQRAVMMGSVLSPACASKWRNPPPNMRDRVGRCLFCDAFGSFQHIFWECASRPPGLRLAPPEDPLARRFGWPLGDARADARRLQHMGAICEGRWEGWMGPKSPGRTACLRAGPPTCGRYAAAGFKDHTSEVCDQVRLFCLKAPSASRGLVSDSSGFDVGRGRGGMSPNQDRLLDLVIPIRVYEGP